MLVLLNSRIFNEPKKLVENVLNLIASEYQSYTSRDRNKKITNLMKYFNEQIQKYKIKVNNSYKEAQEYALKWDLIEDGISSEAQITVKNEEFIFTYKNRIKQLKELLNEIEKTGINEEILTYASFRREKYSNSSTFRGY